MIGVQHFIKNKVYVGITLFMSLCFAWTAYGQNSQVRKAPAYPLITHNPNFSIWSTSDVLTDKTTEHWTGTAHGLTGYIEVDGVLYRFMGEDTPRYQTIIPNVQEESKTQIKYIEKTPNDGWNALDLEDAGWQKGPLPISDNKAIPGTFWETDDI